MVSGEELVVSVAVILAFSSMTLLPYLLDDRRERKGFIAAALDLQWSNVRRSGAGVLGQWNGFVASFKRGLNDQGTYAVIMTLAGGREMPSLVIEAVRPPISDDIVVFDFDRIRHRTYPPLMTTSDPSINDCFMIYTAKPAVAQVLLNDAKIVHLLHSLVRGPGNRLRVGNRRIELRSSANWGSTIAVMRNEWDLVIRVLHRVA